MTSSWSACRPGRENQAGQGRRAKPIPEAMAEPEDAGPAKVCNAIWGCRGRGGVISPRHPLEPDLSAHGRLEQLDGGLGGADRLESLLRVPTGPGGVEHADDHAIDMEATLRDLGDDQVRVVAVGGRHEGVGLLDAGRQERVELERRALREAPAALLPALGLPPVEE